MNIDDFQLNDLKFTTFRVKNGRFSTWKVDNFYWHGPTKFDLSNKIGLVHSYTIPRVPKKKIWYLCGLRQHIWRRHRKIKGFIPFIGIDILGAKVFVVLYQFRPIRRNSNWILDSFFQSVAHAYLKNQVFS